MLVTEDALHLWRACVAISERLPALILTDGDKLHLRGDDPLACVVQLRDVFSCLGTAWSARQFEAQLGQHWVVGATLAVLAGRAVETLGIAALLDPGAAQCRKTAAQVDLGLRVGVGAGGIVDQQRRVVFVSLGGSGRR